MTASGNFQPFFARVAAWFFTTILLPDCVTRAEGDQRYKAKVHSRMTDANSAQSQARTNKRGALIKNAALPQEQINCCSYDTM